VSNSHSDTHKWCQYSLFASDSHMSTDYDHIWRRMQ